VTSRVVPAPSTYRANVPAELDRIVLRALERDADERYRSARDFSRDLEKFLIGIGDTVPSMDVADWMATVCPQGGERIQTLVEMAARVSAATADDTVIRVPSSARSKSETKPAPGHGWRRVVLIGVTLLALGVGALLRLAAVP
jgi:serine/threonine-protein kinase